MKSEAEANAEADNKLREEVELLNKADGVIFQSEKSIKDIDDKLTEDQKTELNTLITELREAYNNKDVNNIQNKIDNLNGKFNEITQVLSEQTNSQNTTGGDEFSDVDYEEVK